MRNLLLKHNKKYIEIENPDMNYERKISRHYIRIFNMEDGGFR